MTAKLPEIVVVPDFAPRYSSGKNDVLPEIKTDFSDSGHWDELARKYLPTRTLPRWETRCTPEKMKAWLDRLNLTEKQYQKYTNTTLKEFMELNPTWPLRAFIGTVLEMVAECRSI